MSLKVNSDYLRTRSSAFNSKADINLSALEICALLSINKPEVENKQQVIATISQPFIESEINSIRYLENQGTFHLLFELTDGNGHQYIVKTNKDILPCSSYNFYIDEWISHHSPIHHVMNCNVYTVDCTRHVVPFDFTLMDKVSGNTLVNFKNDDSQINHYTKLLGENLAQLHQCKTMNYGLIDGLKLHDADSVCHGTQASWQDYIYSNLERHLDYCKTHSIIDLNVYNDLISLFKTTESLINIKEPCLLHGDLNDQNIFVNNNQLTLIDWEDAISGDPVFDIAMWGTFVNHHEKLDILLSGYQAITTLPHDFMLRYWIYYLRIILAKTVIRHRFEYYKTDKIPAIQRIMPPIDKVKHFLSSKDTLCAYS